MEVVDTETAKEFMTETLAAVDVDELRAISVEVGEKSAWFREALGPEALPGLTSETFEAAMRRIFSTRGKSRKALAEYGLDDMRAWLIDLLDGDADPGRRLQGFIDRLADIDDNVRVDFASELMHFARPEKHWLWTRWMWDPRTKTGSLPLVTSASYQLDGADAGEIYMKVGRAVAFVHETGKAAGFDRINPNVFGTDVYLSCVYVVYTYTVLKMRMTQEFNKVMPGLPEFSRRLLGVHKRKCVADQPAATPSQN